MFSGLENHAMHIQQGRKVAKCSGRVAPFVLFLREYGYSEFQNQHAERFNRTDPTHQSKMDRIYKSLPAERIQDFKDRAALLNENMDEVRERRHDQERQRRAYAHDNPDEIYQLKMDINHATRVHLEQRFQETGRPVVMPQSKGYGGPKLLIESDFRLMRDRSRKALRDVFSFDQKNISHRVYNFIGVLNYATVVDTTTASLIVYPAEIAIVKFNLTAGLIAHNQLKISFDARDLFPSSSQSSEDITELVEYQAEKNCEAYLVDPNHGQSIRDVVSWLLQHLDPSEFVLLDAEQFAMQMESLHFLVSRLGTINDRAEFEQLKFHCIQDVGHAIRMLYRSPIVISDNEIERFFSRNMILKDPTNYCVDHSKLASQGSLYYQERQMCPMHQALSKVHLFFEFFAEFNVCGFTYRDVTEQHSPCSDFGETVPLRIKNISLPSHMYVPNLTLPAAVTEEKTPARDHTLHQYTVQQIREATHRDNCRPSTSHPHETKHFSRSAPVSSDGCSPRSTVPVPLIKERTPPRNHANIQDAVPKQMQGGRKDNSPRTPSFPPYGREPDATHEVVSSDGRFSPARAWDREMDPW